MKKVIASWLLWIAAFWLFSPITNAASYTIKVNWETQIITEKTLSRAEVFNKLASYFEKDVPDSYKYIHLNFKDVQKNTELYESLQKLVYLDLIINADVRIYKSAELTEYNFYKIAEHVFDIEILEYIDTKNIKETKVTDNTFKKLNSFLYNQEFSSFKNATRYRDIKEKKSVMIDVYNTLTTDHYNKESINKAEVLDSAIEAMAESLWDKHTVYFPPVESKKFTEHLQWEFEGIGAYVNMDQPGVMKIVSPIKDGPAYNVWLKGWDIITHIDWVEVTENNSSEEVISWIKWKAGTKVSLKILRNGKTLDFEVTRDKIVTKDIETKFLTRDTYYIEIKSFWDHVSEEFIESLDEIKESNKVKKIIIDLRNNGGGYLDQVTDMLSYLVPEKEPTAVVKYLNREKKYLSKGYNSIDLNNYKVIILQNSWTASASEIMIGTLKDYFENITLIWETTYWKGSVQTMRWYKDGSMLKYTIAKWYTGKTETGIDGIGIIPDMEVELDFEKYKKYDLDTQLEKAKQIR